MHATPLRTPSSRTPRHGLHRSQRRLHPWPCRRWSNGPRRASNFRTHSSGSLPRATTGRKRRFRCLLHGNTQSWPMLRCPRHGNSCRTRQTFGLRHGLRTRMPKFDFLPRALLYRMRASACLRRGNRLRWQIRRMTYQNRLRRANSRLTPWSYILPHGRLRPTPP